MVRDLLVVLVGLGLVVVAIIGPGTKPVWIIAILLIVVFAFATVMHGRWNRYVDTRSRLKRLVFSLLGLVFGGYVVLYGIGLSGLGGEIASGTTDNCTYVPGQHTGRSSVSAHYACDVWVTWPDGGNDVLRITQDNGVPQLATVVKPPGMLHSMVGMGPREPWTNATAYAAVGILGFGQGVLSLVILAVGARRDRRAASDLPPGMLPR